MTRTEEISPPATWTASPPEGFCGARTTPDHCWALLLTARRVSLGPDTPPSGLRLGADGRIRRSDKPSPTGVDTLLEGGRGGWRAGDGMAAASPEARDVLALYLPLLADPVGRRRVIAHLGQSVDGCIAAAGGHAFYVTGPENLAHLHRLRALCDAVLLGAGSVAADDPRLSVRLVEGDSPVRVVLDPRRRLASPRRVFDDDGAPTLVVSLRGGDAAATPPTGRAERLSLAPGPDGALEPGAVLDALAARGLHRVFVEGGGVTVTRFVEAGVVDRLHVAVAPVLIGRGVPGLRLPPVATMHEARRPPCRLHRMGDDVLWDFDLAADQPGSASTS